MAFTQASYPGGELPSDVTTKSASWHAAMGSSWRGSPGRVERYAIMASKPLLASSQPPCADQHVRVPVDHEGVPHNGDVEVGVTTKFMKSQVVWAVLANLATESTSPMTLRPTTPAPGVLASPVHVPQRGVP